MNSDASDVSVSDESLSEDVVLTVVEADEEAVVRCIVADAVEDSTVTMVEDVVLVSEVQPEQGSRHKTAAHPVRILFMHLSPPNSTRKRRELRFLMSYLFKKVTVFLERIADPIPDRDIAVMLLKYLAVRIAVVKFHL